MTGRDGTAWVGGALLALAACGGCTAGGTLLAPGSSPTDAALGDGADVAAPEFDAGITTREFTPVPRSRAVEPGVRMEVFTVDAPAPPSNPARVSATPAELNRVQVVRYRADTDPVTPAQSVVVAMPGFLGGAGSFGPLARALVHRGMARGHAIEVWAIDRRSNLLEDLRGMEAAEALGDPELAVGYYLRRNLVLNGQRFTNFLEASSVGIAYMSEWGMATTLGDLHAVISQVPSPREHVVLMGHSLGGTIVEAYAAWDFDGTGGYRDLAGLVLVDGVAAGTSVSESQYLMGGGTGGGFPVPGLTSMRTNGPFYVSLPLLGVRVYATAEIVARRAAMAPEAVVVDAFRDTAFRTLLGVSTVPPLTNAAAMGFAFDDGSCSLAFAAMSCGRPEGGPLMTQPNGFGMGGDVSVPASATATYRWIDAPAATPREFTPIAAAATAWSTPPVNFPEWYFATRLSMDAGALGDMRLASDSWQVREGLRASHGGEIDVPVLAVGTEFAVAPGSFDGLRARIAPTVGAGRPRAGAARSDENGFRVLLVPAMTHIDPLSATDDNPANPVPEAVATFSLGNTTGTVTIAPRAR